MAFVFKNGVMASNELDVCLASAVAEEDINDGSLLVLGELAPNDVYDDNGLEYDTYLAAAPEAATDEVVIVDLADIEIYKSLGTDHENVVKQGIRLYNLKAPAGELMRVRRLFLHDKFWLGEDNFASTPVVGEFATAEAGKYTHKPAEEKPEAGYAIKVLVEEELTIGMASKGKKYLCEVVQL